MSRLTHRTTAPRRPNQQALAATDPPARLLTFVGQKSRDVFGLKSPDLFGQKSGDLFGQKSGDLSGPRPGTSSAHVPGSLRAEIPARSGRGAGGGLLETEAGHLGDLDADVLAVEAGAEQLGAAGVTALGAAADLHHARPPRREHVVDDQGDPGVLGDVTPLLAAGEVVPADEHGAVVVDPERRRDDVRVPVVTDGRQPAEPLERR